MNHRDLRIPLDFLDWIDEWHLDEWEELVNEFTPDGHEPDQNNWSVPTKKHSNGKVSLITKGERFDNAGWKDELRIQLIHNGKTLEFRLTDLVAFARHGYIKLREEAKENKTVAKRFRPKYMSRFVRP